MKLKLVTESGVYQAARQRREQLNGFPCTLDGYVIFLLLIGNGLHQIIQKPAEYATMPDNIIIIIVGPFIQTFLQSFGLHTQP